MYRIVQSTLQHAHTWQLNGGQLKAHLTVLAMPPLLKASEGLHRQPIS
jgi:hypothetical protein